MFLARNRLIIKNIFVQLLGTKKNDMSSRDYYQKMKIVVDAMASFGHPLTGD
jgi:hypothetical protein